MAILACRDAGTSQRGDATAPVRPRASVGGGAPVAADSGSGDAAAGPRGRARISVPAGRLVAGSLPGDEGRDPRLEPAGLEVALGPFEIDRLPYPGDGESPARTGVTHKEAARLCAERGERLCTELEWERACKGDAGLAYPTGEAWNAACAAGGAACASPTGVVGMGTLREWTASEVEAPSAVETSKDGATGAHPARARIAVRGARPDADAIDRRCARRVVETPGSRGADLGFRCCAGAPNAARIPTPRPGVAVRRAPMDARAMTDLCAAWPELRAVRDGARPFSEPEDVAAVRKRPGAAADLEGWTLGTGPLVWNPAGADEVLVVAGRAKRDSFVAAFWRLPGDRWKLASSMVFLDDPGPFALAWHPQVRDQILWTSCWKCPGEGGAIVLRDGRRLVVVQR